jgi:hypothetical protein
MHHSGLRSVLRRVERDVGSTTTPNEKDIHRADVLVEVGQKVDIRKATKMINGSSFSRF